MSADGDWLAKRLAEARSAALGTTGADGRPHLVPIVFVYHGGLLYTAIDHKPKTTRRLRRLANIEANPEVSVLIDRYDEDWSRLWWIRVDGTARIIPVSDVPQAVMSELAGKYPDYARNPPPGPLIEISAGRIVSWAASENAYR